MIGFLGCVSHNNSLNIEKPSFFSNQKFIENHCSHHNFALKSRLNPKFLEDKVFYDNQDVFIAVDGILLNAKQLKLDYACSDNFNLLAYLYKKRGKLFINELKGDFSLILYDKMEREVVVYTNTTTSKPIYYFLSKDGKELFFSSNSYHLARLVKSKNHALTVNTFAFYSIASFNYVFSDHHFTSEIKKLPSGCFLSFKDSLIIENYYNLSNTPQLRLSEKEYLSTIDEMFRSAIKLQYDKDIEYGYNHLSTLSGGLDSRMTTLVAHKLGYKPIDTITFSSPGYWDEIISKQIAKAYKLKHLVFNIKDGDYLKSYKSSLYLNGGMLSYYAASQMSLLYGLIDFSKYGLIHTGQLGDAVVGSTLNPFPYHYKFGNQNPEFSKYYRSKLEEEICNEMQKNESFEMTKFKNHVPNYTMEGLQYIYPYTESMSPFLDKDLMSFCMRIPVGVRKSHNLYYKWMKTYYPDIGRYYYEKTKKRTLNLDNNILRKLDKKFYKYYLKVLGLKEHNNALLNFNMWFQNDNLKQELDTIFNTKIELVEDSELNSNLKRQYNSNNIKTKLKALHAVLTYELYF